MNNAVLLSCSYYFSSLFTYFLVCKAYIKGHVYVYLVSSTRAIKNISPTNIIQFFLTITLTFWYLSHMAINGNSLCKSMIPLF